MPGSETETIARAPAAGTGAERRLERTAAAAREEAAAPPLDDPALYINRELSWLAFNERVLELAEDERVPLLERVKFLAIYATNLDEFFMVRVAGLLDQVEAGIAAHSPDGRAPAEALRDIGERVRELGRRHSRAYTRAVRPALDEAGIHIVSAADCQPDVRQALDAHYAEQIGPILTPLAVARGRPFPYISNLSLSLAVCLRDPEDDVEAFARVKVPKEVVSRFVPLDEKTFAPIEEVMARHLDDLFPGMEILAQGAFRVTRDADFTVSDEADDLLRAVEDELRARRFGEIVRLEVAADMEPRLREWLIEAVDVKDSQVTEIEGPLDLSDLWQIHGLPGHNELRDPPWSPVVPPPFHSETDAKLDVFSAMREHDLLVHHPYESFAASVERFVSQAVEDPDVLAIKQTVYRTSHDSTLIPALVRAAELGKQAVCVLEVTARFDESRNIEWSRALEEAGAHVVHGLPGLKTHAKAILVVRREGTGLRRYVHVGTGNYNAKTARLYEDFGLFSADPDLAADVADLFNALTGYARPKSFRRAVVSPEHTRRILIEQIEETVAAHERGEEARIVLKMNSLVDRRCIEALYRASQAGVPVLLNLRGICCLRPGLPGVSENVRVVSVVGRFLEHSRIYAFVRGKESRYFIGSADLMPRNLDQRVELLAPVADPGLEAELADTLERCFADDSYAWQLDGEGEWERRPGAERSVHAELMDRAAERGEG